MWKKEQIKGFLEKVIIIFSDKKLIQFEINEGVKNYSVVFKDN